MVAVQEEKLVDANVEREDVTLWMDGWILQGANARYVMADVPRIEDGSGSAHSDEGDGSWRC